MVLPQYVKYTDTKHLTEPVQAYSLEFGKKGLPDWSTFTTETFVTNTTTFEPVFCENCQHLEGSYHEFHGGFYRCLNPNNTKTNHNWLHKWFSSVKHPKKLNKNNNCPNFEKRKGKKK